MAEKKLTRRAFLRTLVTAGVSAHAFSLASCSRRKRESFFQKHFLEMTDPEKRS